MNVEEIPIAELDLDPANVRQHDEKNLAAIKSSLKRFGQQKPIVVDPKGIVIAGNGTLTAARALGWQSIQVVRTNLLGAEATAFAIADNRTAELATWDDGALVQQLQALKLEDSALIESAGFDDLDLEKMLEDQGIFDVDAVGMPELSGEDRAPFQQKTFTLHDEQCEDVDAAVSIAKDMGHSQSAINENSNGNALAFICQFFVRAHQ